jgi:hypothetical protein
VGGVISAGTKGANDRALVLLAERPLDREKLGVQELVERANEGLATLFLRQPADVALDRTVVEGPVGA